MCLAGCNNARFILTGASRITLSVFQLPLRRDGQAIRQLPATRQSAAVFEHLTFVMATTMSMAIIFIVTVIAVIVTVIAVMIVVIALAMVFTMTRRIFIVVPGILNEIHAFAARIIFSAVFRPMLGMAGRHVHIDRCLFDISHRPFNDDRLCVDYARSRCIANIDLAIQAGLRDIDRNADIGRHG